MAQFYLRTAQISFVFLLLLCTAWEIWLAPSHAKWFWVLLKVTPLIFPLRGILKGDIYTLQYSSMLILLYFMDSIVSMYTGANIIFALAFLEFLCSILFFICALSYLRPYKQKQRAQQKHD